MRGGTYTVYAPQSLTGYKADWVIAPQVAVAIPYRDRIDGVLLHLGEVTYVDLPGILDLVLLVHLVERTLCRPIRLWLPRERGVLSFLQTWGFLELLELADRESYFDRGYVTGSGVRHRTVRDSDVLVPIERIRGDTDVASFMTRFNLIYEEQTIKEQLLYEREHLAPFKRILSEVIGNIPRHSQSEGLVALKTMRDRTKRPTNLQIAIADAGIGIPNSLRTNARWSQHKDIRLLRMAFRKDVSRTEGEGRGLYTARGAIRRLLGRVIARSGRGMLRHSPPSGGRESMARTRWRTELRPMPELMGTRYDIVLPRLRQEELEEVKRR
jgi:hypothetical protein